MRLLGAILLLWFPFSVAALFSIPILLYGMLTENESIWKPVGRAMDKLLATLCGFSGEYTLSAELSISSRLQLLRKLLDLIEPNHCYKAAVSEKRIN